jgi:hypothetical protein
VSPQCAAPGKPVAEKLVEQVLVIRKRHEAVADVARRKNLVFAAQASRAAAVVHHRHNRGKIRDRMPRIRVPKARDKFLQPAQHGGKPGAAADSDDPPGCVMR